MKVTMAQSMKTKQRRRRRKKLKTVIGEHRILRAVSSKKNFETEHLT